MVRNNVLLDMILIADVSQINAMKDAAPMSNVFAIAGLTLPAIATQKRSQAINPRDAIHSEIHVSTKLTTSSNSHPPKCSCDLSNKSNKSSLFHASEEHVVVFQ